MRNSLRKLYVNKSMIFEEMFSSDQLHELCQRYQLDVAEIRSIGESPTATIQEVKRNLPQSYFLDDVDFKHIRVNDPLQ